MINLLQIPEVKDLISKLFDNLFNESGRGALLIGTAHIDEYLTTLLEAVFPKTLSENQKKRIVSYPGPLSSFAAKIELAYVFRLIPKTIYDSLNGLRKIRNLAAHSAGDFQLHQLQEELKKIYELGPGIPNHIKEISFNTLLDAKRISITEIFKDSDLTSEEIQKEVLSTLANPQSIEKLEKQVPYWELLYYLGLVCGFLVYQKEKLAKMTENLNTWTDLQRVPT